MVRNRSILWICLMLPVTICAPAAGQSIKATASSARCSLDEVLTIRVEVENPTQASMPTPPKTSDFDIRLNTDVANPTVKQNLSIVPGRRSGYILYTYVFDAIPRRAGWLTIPPFTLKDGGKTHESKPIMVHVRGQERIEDVICRVVAPRETVYVGEPVVLSLEVWMRKYTQPGIGSLNVETMAEMINHRRSRLGVFKDVATMLTFDRQEWVRDKGAKAKKGRAYYVYTWTVTVYPTSFGPLDLGDIRIACQYPVQIGRAAFRGLRHVQTPRRLMVPAEPPKLTIKPVPLEGRPADYNGAIGRFAIGTTASPTRVPLGDPITLTMTIHGSVPLQRVGAPKLNQVAALTRDFGVSGESLAGELKPGRKEFSQTIRALREDVTEIPPIPMSFFNPDEGRYDTAWSEAIPIEVLPVERLALPGGAATDAAMDGELTPLLETTDGLQANHVDADVILADQTGGFGVGAVALLSIMPLVYFATWFVTRRSAYYRRNAALRRRRRAYGQAKGRLGRAGGDGRDLGRVVLTYLADRCAVPAAGLTRADAVGLVAERDVPAEAVERLDDFLADLEHIRYAGGSAGDGQRAAAEAREILDRLERCDLS